MKILIVSANIFLLLDQVNTLKNTNQLGSCSKEKGYMLVLHV